MHPLKISNAMGSVQHAVGAATSRVRGAQEQRSCEVMLQCAWRFSCCRQYGSPAKNSITLAINRMPQRNLVGTKTALAVNVLLRSPPSASTIWRRLYAMLLGISLVNVMTTIIS